MKFKSGIVVIPIILATWEEEAGRLPDQDQPQNVNKILSQK
jgi:hypothetical protein